MHVLHDAVLHGLLLRVGIEINNGSLSNALNMVSFPGLIKSVFILSAGFCMSTGLLSD